MMKLGVAGWAFAALTVTASNASAEIITLRCNLNWLSSGEVEIKGMVLDTELRTVQFNGATHTAQGVVQGIYTRQKVGHFDNERIEFGSYWSGGSNIYVVDRITGSITRYHDDNTRATGSCERTQAAF